MKVESTALETVAAVEAIADEWQELHESARDPNPFSGPDWPLTWLRRFADGERDRPLVIAVRAEGRLIGVAPLHLRVTMRGALRMVAPIGVGTPWVLPYELPTTLCAPDLGRDVCREVVLHLCGLGERWDVARVMPGADVGWVEPEWPVDFSYSILVRRLRAEAVLPLADGVNPYTGRRNLKESFRRARNRLTRDHGADGWGVVRRRTPEEVAAGFRTLTALHHARANLDGTLEHADALADERVVDYLAEVVDRMARRDRVTLYELRIGAEAVAMLLVLHTADTSYFSLSGLAPQAWEYSAVTYLQSEAVADAREAGHRLVHLSTGPNRAKMRWTSRVDHYPEFWIVGPRRRSQAAYVAAELASVVTSLREARVAHKIRGERPSR